MPADDLARSSDSPDDRTTLMPSSAGASVPSVPSGGVKAWMKTIFGNKEASLKDAVEEMIQEREDEGGERLSNEEKDMLRNVLEVGDLTVTDVMVPRADIRGVDYRANLLQVKQEFIENGHTRLPVYEQTLDKLKGFIHLKDIIPALAGDEEFSMDAVLRNLMFISPTMKVVDLIGQMRIAGEHIAIVVDEYGGTDGLVTLEDLFEEIVGEIQDEHDHPDDGDEVRQLNSKSWEADGRTRIKTIEELLGFSLREPTDTEDYETLGGLIVHRLGRVPVRGEVVTLEGTARFDIIEADPRRVRKVRMTLLRAATDGQAQAALA